MECVNSPQHELPRTVLAIALTGRRSRGLFNFNYLSAHNLDFGHHLQINRKCATGQRYFCFAVLLRVKLAFYVRVFCSSFLAVAVAKVVCLLIKVVVLNVAVIANFRYFRQLPLRALFIPLLEQRIAGGLYLLCQCLFSLLLSETAVQKVPFEPHKKV